MEGRANSFRHGWMKSFLKPAESECDAPRRGMQIAAPYPDARHVNPTELTLHIDPDLQRHLASDFENERDWNQIALPPRLRQTHEHHMVSPSVE